MAKTTFEDHDAYIASFPPAKQRILQRVREAIRKGAPDAIEVISYSTPAFKTPDGGWVFYYHAHANHYSLACPPPATVWDAFAAEIASYPRSKSTMRLPLDQPVPARLITAMAKHRVKEETERIAAKAAARGRK